MAATKKSKKDRGAEVWSANDFLKNLLEQIPAEQRDSVLEHIGEHVLRHDEFSRLSDEARATQEAAARLQQEAATAKEQYTAAYGEVLQHKTKLDKWKEEQEAAFAGAAPKEIDTTRFVSKDDLARIVAEQRAAAQGESLALTSAVTSIAVRHMKEYGDALDTDALIKHAQTKGLNLATAYADMTAAQREARDEKLAAEKEQKLRETIEREVRSKLGPAALYPVSSESSALAGLVPANAAKFGIDAGAKAIAAGEFKF